MFCTSLRQEGMNRFGVFFAVLLYLYFCFNADSRMNNPSETSKPSMESGDGNTGKKWLIGAQILFGGIEWILKENFFTSLQELKTQNNTHPHPPFFLETWEYFCLVINSAVCRALFTPTVSEDYPHFVFKIPFLSSCICNVSGITEGLVALALHK